VLELEALGVDLVVELALEELDEEEDDPPPGL
jgi:hypothetical protein